MTVQVVTTGAGAGVRKGQSEPFLEGLARRTRRLAKLSRRMGVNIASGGRPETRLVFVMGAQRSGTRVPLMALERAPDILTFREGARRYFQGNLLRPDGELDELLDACAFPVLVLKPLSESHRAVELLDRFPQARVIWIFRGYEDTVNSASLKWSSGAEAVERLVAGTLPPGDWRLGGVTPEALDVVRALYRPGLSLHHANAIMWYLRNRLILDLDIAGRPRALLVKYEDLTTAPQLHFPRVFRFVDQPLKPAYLSGIHAQSVRRSRLPPIPDDVAAACASLHQEIARRYETCLQTGVRA